MQLCGINGLSQALIGLGKCICDRLEQRRCITDRPNVAPVSLWLCSRFTFPIPSAVGSFLRRHVERHLGSRRRCLTRCVSECAFIVLLILLPRGAITAICGERIGYPDSCEPPRSLPGNRLLSSVFREQWEPWLARPVQRSARYRKLSSTAAVWCCVPRRRPE